MVLHVSITITQPVIPSRIQQAGAVASSTTQPAASWLPPAHSLPAVPKPAIPRQPSYARSIICATNSHTSTTHHHHRASKTILSADDIVRARERQRRLALLGGKRPDSDAAQVQTHAAKRARWEAAVMNGVAPLENPDKLLARLVAMEPVCAWATPTEAGMPRHVPLSAEAVQQAARDESSAPAGDGQDVIGACSIFNPPRWSWSPSPPSPDLAPAAASRALPVPPIPWFPTDPKELAQQDGKMEAAGVRLPHQLGHARGRGAVVPGRGRGLPIKRSRPVNIPGFR